MPSTTSEHRSGTARLDLVALIGAIALGALLVWTPGLGLEAVPPVLTLLASTAVVALPLLRIVREAMPCLRMVILMAVFGTIGVLIGSRIDLGPLGLITLADWCSLPLGSDLGAVWRRVEIAPWTHAGMLIGCNLGMLLSGPLIPDTRSRVGSGGGAWLYYNTGMVLGMLIAESLIPLQWASGMSVPAAARMLLIMLAGMMAGTWAGWWLARWRSDWWSRRRRGGQAGAPRVETTHPRETGHQRANRGLLDTL